MTDDDCDWSNLPVLQVTEVSSGLQILGTVDGLGDLLCAIATAMGKGTGTAEMLSPESEVYAVTVKRQDLATEWQPTTPHGDDPLDLWEIF